MLVLSAQSLELFVVESLAIPTQLSQLPGIKDGSWKAWVLQAGPHICFTLNISNSTRSFAFLFTMYIFATLSVLLVPVMSMPVNEAAIKKRTSYNGIVCRLVDSSSSPKY